MGPRAGLDGCGRRPPLGFDPRTVQPVASRYTDPRYAASSGGYLTSEDGTVMLSRNVDKELPLLAA